MLSRLQIRIITLLAIFALTGCATDVSKLGIVVLPKENRPNVIFILTDDLDSKLNSMDYMKNVKELLSAHGASLSDFLISTPVCCPSRSTILRGQYAHSHQVYHNELPDGGFYKFNQVGNDVSNLGGWMQAAGYRTVLMGKYLNGYPFQDNRTYVPSGWTEWYSPAKKSAYDGYDYVLNENGKLVEYNPSEINYFTDVMNRKSVDFIQRAAKDKTPFFMYLSSFAPHEPATPARRHLKLFPLATIPQTPSFNEKDVSDKPQNMSFNPLLSGKEIQTLNGKYRARLRSLQAVDEMVKDLVTVLEQTGQLDNTYIIFTSDNGYHMGQHRLYAGKTTFYEEDIVVPFIARGPGIPENKTIPGFLAGNVDIAATISEWAGVIPPAFVEGRSFAGVLAGDPVPSDWRKAMLLEIYGGQNQNMDGVWNPLLLANTHALTSTLGISFISPQANNESSTGLRTSQYLYTEYKGGFVEFYDLQKDPYELENIAASADPHLVKSLSNWLHTLYACSGKECLNVDQGLK